MAIVRHLGLPNVENFYIRSSLIIFGYCICLQNFAKIGQLATESLSTKDPSAIVSVQPNFVTIGLFFTEKRPFAMLDMS